MVSKSLTKENESVQPLFLGLHKTFDNMHAYHNRIVSWPNNPAVTQIDVNTPKKLIGHPVKYVGTTHAELVLAGDEGNADAILDESTEKVVLKPHASSGLNDPEDRNPINWPLAIVCAKVVLNPFYYQRDALGNTFDNATLANAIIAPCGLILPYEGMPVMEDEHWIWMDQEIHKWMSPNQAEWIGQI